MPQRVDDHTMPPYAEMKPCFMRASLASTQKMHDEEYRSTITPSLYASRLGRRHRLIACYQSLQPLPLARPPPKCLIFVARYTGATTLLIV